MKLTIYVALFISALTIGRAQEVTLKANAGIQGLNNSSIYGSGDVKLGAGLGVGYTYYFTKTWGLTTGFDVNLYRTDFALHPNTTLSSYEVDDQGSGFEYRVSPSGYTEKQQLYGLSIPLMLTYKSNTSGSTGFYAGFGGKVLFPIHYKSDIKASSMQLSGYYPDLNLEIDDLPNHGFGALSNYSGEAEGSLKTTFTASAEAGLYFKLKSHLNLYTGVYADYVITNLFKDTHSNIVSYSSEGLTAVKPHGVFGSEKGLEKSKVLAVGLQVKLGFSLHKETPAQEIEEVVPTIIEEAVEEVVIEETVAVEEVIKETKPTLTIEEKGTITTPLSFGSIDNIEINAELASKLDRIAAILKTHNELGVTITGHTCDVGSESTNDRIGQQRADAVASYLVNKGIDRSRMTLISKGEIQPLVPNNSAANRIQNRRVTISIDN